MALLGDFASAVLFQIGLGPQTQVGGLHLVLPDLLGPEVGLFPILLGAILLKEGFGTQTEVGRLDLVLPNLLGP